MALPAGTVTFWMTDIEGSTRLLTELGEEYRTLLRGHHAVVRAEVARNAGVEISTEGDSFFCVFRSAVDAVRAAAGVQRCLAVQPWPRAATVRVRIGLHTGEGAVDGEGYVGMDVHRVARVCAAGHGGQVLLTAATHALLEGHWPDGLSALPLGAHHLKDLPAAEVLYQLAGDGMATRFPPLRSLETPEYDLPAPITPIFGRNRDAARVVELLADHRLVTLTGPGGMGKTRMALHLAAQLRPTFPDGVVFVPLAEIRDAELVPDEIARALGLPPASFAGHDGVARLAAHLRGRRMLLVLDNIEQLDGGPDVICDLLHAAAGPSVLATSRGPLHLREEQQYPLLPLTTESAVAQFTERARAVRPDLRLGERELQAVTRIVGGVGALPLAVELAAARVRTLSPPQIADRLDRQLGLLSGGPRDLPRRQQTVRSTLLWSYDLLDDEARRAFAAFAALPGGATLEALEDLLPGLDQLTALEALADQGLVRNGRPEEAGRFTMLPVVREFAAECLTADGDDETVRRRAAERIAELVATAGPRLVTDERSNWLDRLQAEHDNLRAALAWATEHAPVMAAAIAGHAWRFWQMRGYLREARAAFAAIGRRLPDDELWARYEVFTALGGVAYWQRDLAAGEDAYAQAVEVAERLDDPRALAEALYNLAFPVWQQQNLEEAKRLADRSHELFARLGDDDGRARVLWLHGVLAVLTRDLEAAEGLLTESVRRHRAGTDAFQLGWSLRMLGRTYLLQGRAEEARTVLEESLATFAPAGDVSAVVLHLSDFAMLAMLEGDVEREVRLVGAVRRLQALTGTDLVDHPINEVPRLAETLAELGPVGDRLLAEGAAMTDEEIVRYALEPAAPRARPDPPSSAVPSPRTGTHRRTSAGTASAGTGGRGSRA